MQTIYTVAQRSYPKSFNSLTDGYLVPRRIFVVWRLNSPVTVRYEWTEEAYGFTKIFAKLFLPKDLSRFLNAARYLKENRSNFMYIVSVRPHSHYSSARVLAVTTNHRPPIHVVTLFLPFRCPFRDPPDLGTLRPLIAFSAQLWVSVFLSTGRPHTIGESLILPSIKDAVAIAFDQKSLKEVEWLSNNTVARRIDEISEWVEYELIESVDLSARFSLQLDESTDTQGLSQTIVFVRKYAWTNRGMYRCDEIVSLYHCTRCGENSKMLKPSCASVGHHNARPRTRTAVNATDDYCYCTHEFQFDVPKLFELTIHRYLVDSYYDIAADVPGVTDSEKSSDER
ncbi:Hypothetical protein CINCED_3A003091 [Cinara cedri]|uniref:Uncharacterized protein n=1 Tax=Cinara cedri TaxID=506608 RepID=A0A5E4M731_9HEMI|nr:Hypothetical protein CINCED_3A003091 [Cinara cedri]